MTRRRLTIFVLTALCSVAVAVIVWAVTPRSGVTRASFEQLREGMSQKEVEALMGRPPDGVEQHRWINDGLGNPVDGEWQTVLSWHRPDGASGFVVIENHEVSTWGFRESDETIWESFERWFRERKYLP